MVTIASSSISAVVMTLNEERNVEYCLRSLRSWCDEIIVVDMHSDDATAEIARRYCDRFLTHERAALVEPAREMGFGAATGDWLLSIDADEIVTPQLAAWLRAFADSDPAYDLARIPRIDVFLGRWIRSRPWWPGKPRFFRPGAIEVTGQLHKGLMLRPGVRVATLPMDPKLAMWHFSYVSLDSLVAKTNKYTTIEARQAREAGGGDPGWVELLSGSLRAMAWYVRRRGYQDGLAGLAYNLNRAYYRFLSVAKRWDEARAGGRQAKYDRMREHILSGYPDGGRPRLEAQPTKERSLGDATGSPTAATSSPARRRRRAPVR